ncbi:MAG: hypothetical protein HY000_08065 [Planctomycetes bacterium]|nr:hypothetical protein [Planctomycetota bacterium]
MIAGQAAKRAARDQEPLLTAAERVQRALDHITASQTLTTEQQRWLERIRSHLVENLSIDRDDFDVVPVFKREGGWGVANKAFNGRLDELLHQINEAVAA